MKSLQTTLLVCALALTARLSPAAVTQVDLSPSATPAIADAGVTTVTVVGHNFPSGTIPPANVTVTLKPAIAGSGPTATTAATAVTVVSGSTERITLKVPASITVNTATPYQITIAGTTSTGNAFASDNSAALTINAPVVITTNPILPTATVNNTYSETLTATGGSTPYTWAVTTGSLPIGLSLNAATGVISGKPVATATVTFKVTVTDSLHMSATRGFSLTVTSNLSITTLSPLPTATVGTTYSQTFQAVGGAPPYTWSVSLGPLPAGLTLDPATGILSGAPTTAGSPQFGIQVTDNKHATASKTFSLTVNPQLQITTTSPLPPATVGSTYSQTFQAVGGVTPYTWSVSSGALPGGLTLDAGTGILTGKPTTAGSPQFGIQVTDNSHATASATFTLTINPQLQITTTSPLPAATVGLPYSQVLKATGGSRPYTWSVSQGSLPAGLALNPSTGVISGQPTAGGSVKFGIQVTDNNHAAAQKGFTLPVNSSLMITTTSPLPAATVSVLYSQAFAASGGSGGYIWSSTGLPSWLTLTAAGLLSGTPPATATNAAFTITVIDSSTNTASQLFTAPITLSITTTSLPDGAVGLAYSQALAAVGGTGLYTWSLTSGTLPGGLTLTAATGAIAGQPTTATVAHFTAQVQDSANVTAAQPFTLTVAAAPTLLSVSPESSNAGLELQVTIAGANTHFLQGSTVATFGAGISVGGAANGIGGPVKVISPTSVIATINISATAALGLRTVTVATGSEHVSLPNSFTVSAAIPYISVTTNTSLPLPQGFSGLNDAYLATAVEYWDPKYVSMVQGLKPGWLRFPSGTPDMAFNWQTGHMNQSWLTSLGPKIDPGVYVNIVRSAELTQGKCGANFSDYANLLHTLQANGIVVVNGFTDNNPNSSGKLVTAAQYAGVSILEWEIDNEPYCCPGIFSTAASYISSAYNPYNQNIVAADPNANVGLFLMGQFTGLPSPPQNYQIWDSIIAGDRSPYWKSVSYHVYPITDKNIATPDAEQTLNGFLAHGTTEYFNSYIQPLIGTTTPVYITELNSDGFGTLPFQASIFNAVYIAEFIARMSTVPQVKVVGVTDVYLGNMLTSGAIKAVDDFEDYLINNVLANPSYCTNTATDPNTQFQFYYSTSGLALTVANQAINSSNATWPTTVTGSPTVPIQGYDNNPVPAIFSQAYQGADGTHYVLVTNKSGNPVPVAIVLNGLLLPQSVTVSYISNPDDTAQNTATNQTNVKIVTVTSSNPIIVGPYSVTRVQW